MNLKSVVLIIFLLVGVCVDSFANDSNSRKLTESDLNIQTPTDDVVVQHKVVQGETAYSIALTYNTTVNEIYRLNPSAEEGIKAGDNLLVPQPSKAKVASAVVSYIEHKVEPKETLYSLATKYNIKVDDIKQANEGLDEATFKAGKKIRIPLLGTTKISAVSDNTKIPSLREYKVRKQETLYNLSKAWNVSIDDIKEINPSIKDSGLKDGSVIYMPLKAQFNSDDDEYMTPLFSESGSEKSDVRVAVLLPFLQSGEKIDREKVVEYYEGVLLAVKEMKAKGMNAYIYSFDIGSHDGTDRLANVLETQEVKAANLIIGGISPQQIAMISDFSKKNNIKYVVPFGAVEAELKNNPNIFQATNSHSSLYGDIVTEFKKVYSPDQYNFIFASKPEKDKNDKDDFVEILKKSLSGSKTSYKTVSLNTDFANNLKTALVADKKNLVIPTSSSKTAVRKMMPVLTSVEGGEQVALFGYPDWQIYDSFVPNFHKLDTYIYSIFYFDSKQEAVRKFDEEYKLWYGKHQVKSYPKYAHLGYDMALYFLTALNKYGVDFEKKIGDISVPTLQSAMKFKKEGQGGYINTGLYFIHYKTDSKKEKLDL